MLMDHVLNFTLWYVTEDAWSSVYIVTALDADHSADEISWSFVFEEDGLFLHIA